MSSNGSSRGRFRFPFTSCSSVIPAFSHPFAMGGVVLSLAACRVFVKDKNQRGSRLVQGGLEIPIEAII